MGNGEKLLRILRSGGKLIIDFSKLEGKVVAITGASRGIGRETAKLLSQYGAKLLLGSRNFEDLERFSNSLKTETLPVALDVTDDLSVSNFAEQGINHFEKVDAIINCAGTGSFEELLHLSTEAFDNMIATNLRGTFSSCQYFGRHLEKRGSGHIINVISIAGTTALPGCAGYSASKFGVLGLTKVLQAELRGKGIKVTAVLPGAVRTPFWDSIAHKPDTSKMIPPEVLAQHIVYLMCQPEGAVVDEITIMPLLGIL
ncbi:SDR family oxidoreductase [Paenibacillus cremeus]|uniref:SDR family oxidoreductase n=1 Tax=Paenibacillus cremeus TaxID=2163881 RepID=A0A559K7G0_9BACL|nr:SDR family oxidoreductase [Paenibacillus cremeus]TVY08070.1 SDR family oxidoreductase [Paenibacillus cremeus]